MSKIQFMYEQYRETFEKNGAPEGQVHMLACLAVKDEFGDNMDTEDLKELRDIMGRYGPVIG